MSARRRFAFSRSEIQIQVCVDKLSQFTNLKFAVHVFHPAMLTMNSEERAVSCSLYDFFSVRSTTAGTPAFRSFPLCVLVSQLARSISYGEIAQIFIPFPRASVSSSASCASSFR